MDKNVWNMLCLVCKRRVRPGRNIRVIERGQKTEQGFEREMEVEPLVVVHEGCFQKATRRYRRGEDKAPGEDSLCCH